MNKIPLISTLLEALLESQPDAVKRDAWLAVHAQAAGELAKLGVSSDKIAELQRELDAEVPRDG